jgi:hypothetical protein
MPLQMFVFSHYFFKKTNRRGPRRLLGRFMPPLMALQPPSATTVAHGDIPTAVGHGKWLSKV